MFDTLMKHFRKKPDNLEAAFWQEMRLQQTQEQLVRYAAALRQGKLKTTPSLPVKLAQSLDASPNNALSYAINMCSYGEETYQPATLNYFDFDKQDTQTVILETSQYKDDLRSQYEGNNFHTYLGKAGIIPLSQIPVENLHDYTPFACMRYSYYTTQYGGGRVESFHIMAFDINTSSAKTKISIHHKPKYLEPGKRDVTLDQFMKNEKSALEHFELLNTYGSPKSLQDRSITILNQPDDRIQVTLSKPAVY